MKQENQFENEEEAIEESFPANFNEETTKTSNEQVFASAPQGQVFDYMNTPDVPKAPPFVDLNGETVTLLEAVMLLPSKDLPWTEAMKNKSVKYKPCRLTLFFDKEKQQTNISGVTVFQRENGAYSLPNINPEGKTQATDLLKKIAAFKKCDIKEVTMRDFMIFLNSKPKVKIIKKEVENPKNGKIVEKNMVDKFV